MTVSTPQITRLAAFIPFDGLSPSHLDALGDQIQVHRLPAGRMVFKRGETDRFAWFLIDGTLDLIDAGFSVRPFAADDDENYLAVDNYPRHTVNAITREPCVLYSLDRDKLDLLMAWAGASDLLPESKPGDDDRDWMDALLSSGLFAHVAPTRLHELFMRFQPRAVELGQEIVREGAAGDTFYVIKRGHAMVTRGSDTLAGLGPGRFFGEDALISDQPRNATVTMTSDGDLMTLDKTHFQQIVQASVVRRISESELQRRVLEGESPCQLIDVRLAMEARHDRIPGARHIPLAELRQQALKLAPEFIYILCAEGRRSELGAYLLCEAGHEAYVLEREGASDTVADTATPISAP